MNSGTNLNYRYVDTSGKEINIDLDRGLYRGRAKSYQPNYYFDKYENSMFEAITYNNTPTDIDIYTGKVDFNLPLGKGKIAFGSKYSYVNTDNTLDFFSEDNGVIKEIPERSYHFIYKENVAAGYLAYTRVWQRRWTLNAGFRIEQTNSEGVLRRDDGVAQPDNHVKRSYFDVFPNSSVSWEDDNKNRLTLSYSRRIDRPNYQNLNPFEMKLDELTYVKGNSFLRPQYTDNIELTHVWKNRITTTLGFSHIKDLATQTVDTFRNYTYAFAKNIATQNIHSITISSPIAITTWWNGFANAWFNFQVFKGTINTRPVRLETTAFGIYTQHNFILGKDYTAELTGWYNGPAPLGPTLLARSMGGVDIGLQKQVLQKRGVIKILATDIFKTSVPFRAKTDFDGLLLRFWVTRESQTARISFTYRFGNTKVKAARQRQSGLESESKRIVSEP